MAWRMETRQGLEHRLSQIRLTLWRMCTRISARQPSKTLSKSFHATVWGMGCSGVLPKLLPIGLKLIFQALMSSDMELWQDNRQYQCPSRQPLLILESLRSSTMLLFCLDKQSWTSFNCTLSTGQIKKVLIRPMTGCSTSTLDLRSSLELPQR